jgi:hypothetical protein
LRPVAVATAAIIVLRILSAALQPRRFASPEERRVDGAIRCRQLQPIAIRRTSTTDAFAASRMRTPRGPSRTLWSLHQTVSTSDVPFVTGRHTRVEILFARCAVLSQACCSHFYVQLTEAGVELTCWSEDPASPQQFSRCDGPKPENAFRRLRGSRAFTHERRIAKIFWTLSTCPHRFAFYPSAPVRQAMLRISSRLAPSLATTRPCDRPVKKTRDALNRLLPLKRKRAPAPRAFPIRSAAFAAWTSHGE